MSKYNLTNKYNLSDETNTEQLAHFPSLIRYAKRKDDEYLKLSIGVRRELEDNMRMERVNIKQALETTNKRERETAVNRCKDVSCCKYQN